MEKKVSKKIGLNTRSCCVCGKEFECTSQYAYKKRIGGNNWNYFCSYKCLNAYKR